MKITVIVPTYCPGNYLFECLDSIIHQTFPPDDYEVIIIQNGVKDPYAEIIDNYIKELRFINIRYLYTSIKGVSNARNIGLDNARGDYICFIDDDDIISSNYLEELFKVSSRYYVGLTNIFSFINSPSELGRDFFVSDYLKDKEIIEHSSVANNRSYISFPVAKLFHREIIGSRRFDIRFDNGEDGLFSRLISDGYNGLRCTSETAIYYVRIRKGSASRTIIPFIKIFKDTLLLWKTLTGYYFSNPKGYSLKLYLISFLSVVKNDITLLNNKKVFNDC